jgi:hypothetical protein
MKILIKAAMGDHQAVQISLVPDAVERAQLRDENADSMNIRLTPEVARYVADLIRAKADQVETMGGASAEVIEKSRAIRKDVS